jgi:hypothetical protein
MPELRVGYADEGWFSGRASAPRLLVFRSILMAAIATMFYVFCQLRTCFRICNESENRWLASREQIKKPCKNRALDHARELTCEIAMPPTHSHSIINESSTSTIFL